MGSKGNWFRKIDHLMNLERYFKSLGREVEALKTRVRDLKDSTHWLTDGEWIRSEKGIVTDQLKL